MVRTRGGVQSKYSDITPYAGRHDVERAFYAGKNSKWLSYRPRNAAWYESYNDAIALYKYMITNDNYNYDIAVNKNGTTYDEKIDSFMEAELIFDSNFNKDAFNTGRNHAIRIIRLKNKEIKLEYLGDFVESDIINQFQEYLKISKNNGIGGR